MHFPMFVVRVGDFLEMVTAIPHQELRKADLAVEHQPGSGLAIFVSHQWCSRRHPDPQFHQLSVLQTVFRTAAAGKLHLDTDVFGRMVFHLKPVLRERELTRLAHASLWYDYFSVPQPDAPMAGSDQHTDQRADLGKAVMSIPAYVDRCEYFLILAPSVPHADDPERTMDFTTWKSRGWCRLERAARVLSPQTTHMLLVNDGRTLLHVGAQHYLLDAVGDGAFTVDTDREILGPVLVDLLSRKLQALLAAGDLHRYRRLLSARGAILHALPGVVPSDCCASGFRPQGRADTVGEFLDLYGFRSATDAGGGSVPPILFAATLGDPGLLEGLLARRANIMARESRHDAEFVAPRGDTALHRACMVGYEVSAVQVLLRHRADLDPVDGIGSTPLMMASIGGHTEAVGALLSAGAEMCARDKYSVDPLTCAAAFGRLAVVRQLLALGHPVALNDGMSPLLAASLFGSGPATVSAILQAPDCSLEARFHAPSRIVLLFAWRTLRLRLWGSRKRLDLLLYHLAGATPLMVAAIMGNIAEARALVAAGADATARNSRGMTAADLAELVGTSPLNLAFFRSPETGEYLN